MHTLCDVYWGGKRLGACTGYEERCPVEIIPPDDPMDAWMGARWHGPTSYTITLAGRCHATVGHIGDLDLQHGSRHPVVCMLVALQADDHETRLEFVRMRDSCS